MGFAFGALSESEQRRRRLIEVSACVCSDNLSKRATAPPTTAIGDPKTLLRGPMNKGENLLIGGCPLTTDVLLQPAGSPPCRLQGLAVAQSFLQIGGAPSDV